MTKKAKRRKGARNTRKHGVANAKPNGEGFYSTSLMGFTAAVEDAIATSHLTACLQGGERRFWASVLFTRLCTLSVSILSLCPGSKLNPRGVHWDSSTVLSLTRNLFECALTFFYFGIEAVSEDEKTARLLVMQLHDCTARFRMFRDFDAADDSLVKFMAEADELRAILQSNPFFLALPIPKQNKLLKGEAACILSQDEILERMGEFAPSTRGFYRFLSAHTHSFPVSFYRMDEQERGRGEESEVEKKYLSMAIEFCTNSVIRCTSDMQTEPPRVLRRLQLLRE